MKPKGYELKTLFWSSYRYGYKAHAYRDSTKAFCIKSMTCTRHYYFSSAASTASLPQTPSTKKLNYACMSSVSKTNASAYQPRLPRPSLRRAAAHKEPTAAVLHSTNNPSLQIPSPLDTFLQSLQQGRFKAAISLMIKIQQTNPALLANLPIQHYTLLITGYYYNKSNLPTPPPLSERIVQIYSSLAFMHSNNIILEYDTLLIALEIYGQMGEPDQIASVYSTLVKRGYSQTDPSLLRAMCRAYIFSDNEPAGLDYFAQLTLFKQSTFDYNSLIDAYALKGNEAGMFSVLDKMQGAGLEMNANTIAIITQYFSSRKCLDMVKAYISHFKNLGGVLNQKLYRFQMSLANGEGEFDQVMRLVDEMKAAGIQINDTIRIEKLIAYAGMGDAQSMWKLYKQLARSTHISKRGSLAMVKMLGPATHLAVMDQVRVDSLHFTLSPYRVLSDLLSGYAIIPDILSARRILVELEQIDGVMENAYILVLWAYYNSNDVNGAIEYAMEIGASQTPVGIEFWYALLVCVIKFEPNALDTTVGFIQKKYPDINIEHHIFSARLRARVESKPHAYNLSNGSDSVV
ncbi:hypothetical protein O5D80_007335 [Batrachochytrium dendrobatidis]|nr:hypothetical protein O5D80_007335 [Batrachochytrium dendrobatidis]